MSQSIPSKLLLQNRMYLSGKHGPNPTVLTLIVVGVFILLLIAIKIILGDTVSWEDLLHKIVQKLRGEPAVLLALIAVVLYMPYIVLARRRERLVLTPLGIEYVSPLPAMLQSLQPSWSLPWTQIRRAEIKLSKLAPRLEAALLVLDAGRAQRSLRPHLWVDPATYSRPSITDLLMQLRRPDPDTIVKQVMESPVMQFLAGLQINIERTDAAASMFALDKNPWALSFVVAFLGLAVYAFIDTFITNSEAYAGQPFYEYYVLGGVLMGALGIRLMRRGKVPWTESVAVAAFTGAAFGAALYPGLLRLNQLTDTQGLQTYRYIMRQPAQFVPIDKDSPVIDFPERHREFWSQYASGREESFELRQGGLGFYQINMQPLYDRIREYYENKKPEARKKA